MSDKNTHCRIRSWRPKSESNLHVIAPRPKSNYREDMHRSVDIMYDYIDNDKACPGVAVYSIVMMAFDGTYNAFSRMHPDAFIGRAVWPSVVGEILRRYNMEDVAHEVVRGKL